MNKISKTSASRMKVRRSGKLSSAALADYLSHLADGLDGVGGGNPALVAALQDLAQVIRSKRIFLSTVRDLPSAVDPTTSIRKKNVRERFVSLGLTTILSDLSEREILEFLQDERKTKEELLRLAAERFSMPLSQLRRSKNDEIKSAILSALHHEKSMQIISTEAEREGKSRSS